MLKLGGALPECKLWELVVAEDSSDATTLRSIDIASAASEKVIVVFGVPGAFTPVCSTEHVPGFLDLYTHFKNMGVDEIWCISVNDVYALKVWAEQLGIDARIRMLSDGNAAFAKVAELERDLTHRGMGIRLQRFSMLLVNGIIEVLNIEPEGKFVVSDAQQLYIQAQGVLDKFIHKEDN